MSEVKIKISANASQTLSTFNQVKGGARSLAKEVSGGLKDAILTAFSIEAIKGMIESTVEWADEIQKASQRLGITIENVQALRIAAREAGKSFQDIEGSLVKLEQAAAKALGGPGKQRQAFQRLGVSDEDLKHLNKIDLLSKVAQGVNGQDRSQATANLAPIVGLGNVGTILGAKDNLANFQQFKNEQKGHLASAEDIQALAALKDKIDEISDAAKSQFAPVLTAILDWILRFGRGVKQLTELIGTEFGAVLGSIQKFDVKGLLTSFGDEFVGGLKNIFKNAIGIITGKVSVSDALSSVAEKSAEAQKHVLDSTFGDGFTDNVMKVVEDKLVEQAKDDQNVADAEAKRKAAREAEQKSFDAPVNRQPAPGSQREKGITSTLGDNSLAKNGNIIGKDTLYSLERIGQLQLEALNKIVDNTTPDTYSDDADGQTPSSDF